MLATSPKDIIGTWFGISADGMYLRFLENGSLLVATSVDKLPAKPDEEMTYRFEGTRLIMTETNATGLPSCGDKPAEYGVQLLADGSIRFVVIADPCLPRRKSTAMVHKPIR